METSKTSPTRRGPSAGYEQALARVRLLSSGQLKRNPDCPRRTPLHLGRHDGHGWARVSDPLAIENLASLPPWAREKIEALRAEHCRQLLAAYDGMTVRCPCGRLHPQAGKSGRQKILCLCGRRFEWECTAAPTAAA